MTQRIIFAQDLNFFSVPGGAEMNDKAIFLAGATRGYDMQLMTPDLQHTTPIKKEDIIILSNVTAFDHTKLLNLPCRTVTFNHDYGLWCIWRLYLPMSRRCLSDCPGYEYGKQIFEKASCNIFLSPLHYEVHKMRFKEAIEPHFCVPSAIDVSQFYPLDKRKKKKSRSGACNLNGLLTFKGREVLLEWAKNHAEIQLDIGGAAEEPGVGRFDKDLPANVKYIGPISYDKLNEWYNKYEYYVELPNTPQPYNRSCIEGILAGCSLITNKLMGCMSYDWANSHESIRKHVALAPKLFWDNLERELKL